MLSLLASVGVIVLFFPQPCMSVSHQVCLASYLVAQLVVWGWGVEWCCLVRFSWLWGLCCPVWASVDLWQHHSSFCALVSHCFPDVANCSSMIDGTLFLGSRSGFCLLVPSLCWRRVVVFAGGLFRFVEPVGVLSVSSMDMSWAVRGVTPFWPFHLVCVDVCLCLFRLSLVASCHLACGPSSRYVWLASSCPVVFGHFLGLLQGFIPHGLSVLAAFRHLDLLVVCQS